MDTYEAALTNGATLSSVGNEIYADGAALGLTEIVGNSLTAVIVLMGTSTVVTLVATGGRIISQAAKDALDTAAATAPS